MTKTAKLSEDHLKQFTGTETWFRHGINPDILFTEGAKYVADEGGAYWLLDAIAIAQLYEKDVAAEEFQGVETQGQSRPDSNARLRGRRLSRSYKQYIRFTDFPLDAITLWVANNVIYLPSEH